MLLSASHEDVSSAVCRALRRLFELDGYLLSIRANERSITHRFAIHLAYEFPDWDVDCEYNRNLDEIKQLIPLYETETIKATDIHSKTVFPDIIVHERGQTKNLLVIEVKKEENPTADEQDVAKLRAFVNQLKYRHALFLKLSRVEPWHVQKEWICSCSRVALTKPKRDA
jgi:hypothetical protein